MTPTPSDTPTPEPTVTSDGASMNLVVVSGAGRSGTSTIAGTLKLLGLYVPQPEIPPNNANPRGYFEPAWVVEFHKRVLKAAGVHTLDGRPQAAEILRDAMRDESNRRELRDWLATQLRDQTVVKDPRTFWLQQLWRDVASGLGARTSFLTMLRHPAEVAASRGLHYLKDADDDTRRARETGNIAGWTNVMLTHELNTRDSARTFVRYSDLLADWRSAVGTVEERLGLRYDPAPSQAPHPVDDFIDTGLHRAQVTWSDVDVLPPLRDLAQKVWEGLTVLADRPDDTATMADLDSARNDYLTLYGQASAFVHDQTMADIRAARRKARRRAPSGVPADVRAPEPSVPRRLLRRLRSR